MRGPTKLRHHCVIGVSAHGKGIGDATSNTLTGSLKEGVSICPGTRLSLAAAFSTSHRTILELDTSALSSCSKKAPVSRVGLPV